jgi:RNA polymerase nonessential primary-like sigma factor
MNTQHKPRDRAGRFFLLADFVADFEKYPLLDRAAEKKLLRKAYKGCEKSRELLINSNLRLVVYVARGVAWREDLLMDCVAEGCLGLITAVERFNPYK